MSTLSEDYADIIQEAIDKATAELREQIKHLKAERDHYQKSNATQGNIRMEVSAECDQLKSENGRLKEQVKALNDELANMEL